MLFSSEEKRVFCETVLGIVYSLVGERNPALYACPFPLHFASLLFLHHLVRELNLGGRGREEGKIKA